MNSKNPADVTAGRTMHPGMTRVAHFAVFHRQYLDPDGQALCELPASVREPALLKDLYRQMTLARLFDEKAVALQRTGRLGTYASSLGQEAIGAAVATAMGASDVLFPSFREHGAQLQRGVSVAELLLYWGGDERGNNFAVAREDFPNCVPIATHLPHAAGCALAFKLRDEPRVAVAIAGDGATSKGDFYEAINIAGAWQLPLLVVVANNGWAISMPRSAQSRARTLAQKAISAGIPAQQVDGNDVLATYAAMHEALAEIRAGDGPRLIEALTYRLADHTTADDATRYRSDEEVSGHWLSDPLARLRKYLVAQAGWAKHDEQLLIEQQRALVERGLEQYLNTPPESVASAFDSLFDTLPRALQQQRADAIASQGQHDA